MLSQDPEQPFALRMVLTVLFYSLQSFLCWKDDFRQYQYTNTATALLEGKMASSG